MPKSYLASEPGAQRAVHNGFDPYLQVYNRLQALSDMGHPVDKAELLVLGGTWSCYPGSYQRWFIKRLFEALNDFGQGIDQRASALNNKPQIATWAGLLKEQNRNVLAPLRSVGLVLETRPDYVTAKEVLILRRLGATKIQIGVQCLNDKVLSLNCRGHRVSATRRAFRLLRLAGFKIHAHWMPNLYGSTPKQDKNDYLKLFSDPDFCPDELKIYPCSLIANTPLVALYKNGLWRAYSKQELLDVITFCLTHTPRWCRLSRVVRDIPSHEIVVGNKLTNFRELAQKAVINQGGKLLDIRAREIKSYSIENISLRLKTAHYQASISEEIFLEYVTPDDHIAAFLRLSLPLELNNKLTAELSHSAVIRELHVYGQATKIGHKSRGAQHLGLGKRLIKHALAAAHAHHYTSVPVISAIGTREYYRKFGFTDGILYQHFEFKNTVK